MATDTVITQTSQSQVGAFDPLRFMKSSFSPKLRAFIAGAAAGILADTEAVQITSKNSPSVVTSYSNIVTSGVFNRQSSLNVTVNGETVPNDSVHTFIDTFGAVTPLRIGENTITVQEVLGTTTNTATTKITRVAEWSPQLFHRGPLLAAFVPGGLTIVDVIGHDIVGYVSLPVSWLPSMVPSSTGSIIAAQTYSSANVPELMLIDVPRGRIISHHETPGLAITESRMPGYACFFTHNGDLYGFNSIKCANELVRPNVFGSSGDSSAAFAVSPSLEAWAAMPKKIDGFWAVKVAPVSPSSAVTQYAGLEQIASGTSNIAFTPDGQFVAFCTYGFARGDLYILRRSGNKWVQSYAMHLGDFPDDIQVRSLGGGAFQLFFVSRGNGGFGNPFGGMYSATFSPNHGWIIRELGSWDEKHTRLALSPDGGTLAVRTDGKIEFARTSDFGASVEWTLITGQDAGPISYIGLSHLNIPATTSMSITHRDEGLTLSWAPVGGALQYATHPQGPWLPYFRNQNPQFLGDPAWNGQMYYRVQRDN